MVHYPLILINKLKKKLVWDLNHFFGLQIIFGPVIFSPCFLEQYCLACVCVSVGEHKPFLANNEITVYAIYRFCEFSKMFTYSLIFLFASAQVEPIAIS